jgi:ankyrin repeat protein
MKILLQMVAVLFTACGYQRNTPLIRAVMSENVHEARNLLASGRVSADDVQNALVAAVRTGETVLIPDLLKAGGSLDKPAGNNSWTPLQHAIHKNQIGSARTLINAGADPNRSDTNGRTPLMMAAGYGYTGLVRLLLEKGADPSLKSPGQLTALDSALTGTADIDRWTAGRCQTGTVQALLDHTPGLRPASIPSLLAKRCPEIDRMLNGQQSASK